MEDLKQAFVEYASSRTDEAGGKWYTFKPEQNNLGDIYNPSWRSYPNLRWRQPQNSQNNFSNLPNRFQPNDLISNRSFNNRPQNYNNQSNIEGLVSEFMASQDARLSKFEADFKRQQGEMTNKIDIVLKIRNALLSRPPRSTLSKHISRRQPFTKPSLAASPKFEITPRATRGTHPTHEDRNSKDLHLNLPVLEVLAHAPIYNAILDKYMESLELGKNGSAFVQGEVPTKNGRPQTIHNTLLLEETGHIFGLADETKSYPIGIVKDVEVHIGKLKLLNDFYVIDMKKDPETPLLVGKGFLAIANAILDCRMAKIAVGEGIIRLIFGVKGVDLGEEEATYWTTLRKRESYKP
ncbi:MAK10-like protein [Tanacetum coccineum]